MIDVVANVRRATGAAWLVTAKREEGALACLIKKVMMDVRFKVQQRNAEKVI